MFNYRKAFLGLFFGRQTSSKLFNVRAPAVTLAETVFVRVRLAKQPLDSRGLENAAIFQVKAVCSSSKGGDLFVN